MLEPWSVSDQEMERGGADCARAICATMQMTKVQRERGPFMQKPFAVTQDLVSLS